VYLLPFGNRFGHHSPALLEQLDQGVGVLLG
jgi:hypothetical protein